MFTSKRTIGIFGLPKLIPSPAGCAKNARWNAERKVCGRLVTWRSRVTRYMMKDTEDGFCIRCGLQTFAKCWTSCRSLCCSVWPSTTFVVPGLAGCGLMTANVDVGSGFIPRITSQRKPPPMESKLSLVRQYGILFCPTKGPGTQIIGFVGSIYH